MTEGNQDPGRAGAAQATRDGSGEAPRHGGARAVAAARRHDVSTMFTLSGGHVFPLYDGAVKADPPMRLVDVRHEQTAVFAAEATARLTRRPGLAVLTAGPGVTNGISAITTAHFNGSAVVVLGGRAPDYRWGSGSLQEIDHPLLLAPVTKRAWTEHRADQVGAAVNEAFRIAATAHRGPVFLDFSLEALFGEAAEAGPASPVAPPAPAPDPADVDVIAGLLAGASRPVLVLGSDVWLGAAETAARAAAEELSLPVITNGQARGVLPAGHDLLVTRARSVAFREADLVVVVGTPLDFRLGYGEFGGKDGAPPAQVVHVADAPGQIATHCPLAASAAGDLAAFFTALAGAVPRRLRLAGTDGPARARLAGVVAAPAPGRPRRGGGGRRRPADLRRRPRPSVAHLWRARPAARRGRGGDRRRRRLRLLRGQVPRAADAPAGGSIPARTDAWAPASATRSPPASRGRRHRWCCCWATARRASR